MFHDILLASSLSIVCEEGLAARIVCWIESLLGYSQPTQKKDYGNAGTRALEVSSGGASTERTGATSQLLR